MSETAVNTTTGAVDQATVPASDQAAATVAVQPVAPAGPLDRREARRQIREESVARDAETAEAAVPSTADSAAPDRVSADTVVTEEAGKSATPVVGPDGRKRDPVTGQFLPEDGVEKDADATTDPAAADGRAEDTGSEAPPAEERAKPIRIEIDPKHAVYGMGETAIEAANPKQEQVIRALLNGTYTRRQENEALQAKLQEVQQKLVRLESDQAATQKWTSSPEYHAIAEKYQEIRDVQGQEVADAWWRSPDNQKVLQELRDSEYNERWGKIETERVQQAATEWIDQAWQHTRSLPEPIRGLPDFGRWFKEEAQLFDKRVELGHYPDAKAAEDLHREFTKALGARLLREPAVAAAYRNTTQTKVAAEADTAAKAAEAKRREDQIRADAVEQFKREAAAKRENAPPHPLGNLSGAARGGRVGGAAPEEIDTSDMSPQQLKKLARAGASQDARSLFTR